MNRKMLRSIRGARPSVLAIALTLLLAMAPAITHGAEYDVPGGFATLQLAVNAAAGSGDVENFINVGAAVHLTAGDVILPVAFDVTRHLTIRPDPDAAFTRAVIACSNGFVPIFRFQGAGYVTIQDLDLVRNATNANDLIQMMYPGTGNDYITIERCRIGSIWTTSGSPGWSYVRIWQPKQIILRNNIFFAYTAGTFDYGIRVENFAFPDNSILLYNNDVADHKLFGISISNDEPGSLVLLRNNVVTNHLSLVAEPFAYQSDVSAGVTVETSHNTAFAGGPFIEQQLDAQSILSAGAASFILLPRAIAAACFADVSWNLAPPWDPNVNFFRLVDGGALHDAAADEGATIEDGAPSAFDIAVSDDWELDPRPSGTPTHFDRGADQIAESTTGTPLGAADATSEASTLWARPASNPARTVGVQFRASESGEVRFEVFDAAGRRLHDLTRAANADELSRLEWDARGASGVHYYRVTLTPNQRPAAVSSGKITLVR
ncbi:MAG: hypothetical protein ACKVU1_04555 [bacterium]